MEAIRFLKRVKQVCKGKLSRIFVDGLVALVLYDATIFSQIAQLCDIKRGKLLGITLIGYAGLESKRFRHQ
ncbi:MAG: hypothetical protein ACTSQ8_26280 [Candidatus Helarchaeota archaeon]